MSSPIAACQSADDVSGSAARTSVHCRLGRRCNGISVGDEIATARGRLVRSTSDRCRRDHLRPRAGWRFRRPLPPARSPASPRWCRAVRRRRGRRHSAPASRGSSIQPCSCTRPRAGRCPVRADDEHQRRTVAVDARRFDPGARWERGIERRIADQRPRHRRRQRDGLRRPRRGPCRRSRGPLAAADPRPRARGRPLDRRAASRARGFGRAFVTSSWM